MGESDNPFRHQTERLVLRDWREEDWAPFWEVTNTPSVMKWLGGVADEKTRLSAQERLLRYRHDFGHTFWVVERKEDGAILGFCGLKRCTDENGPFGMMEAGWRLREDAWGKGYAKEAAIASINLAFDRFGADEVIAMTLNGNEASWGMMLRLGLKRREDLDFPGTSWSRDHGPVIVYSVTHDEWRAYYG